MHRKQIPNESARGNGTLRVRTAIATIAACLAFLLIAACSDGSEEDEAAIRAVFSGYISALEARDGWAAAEYLCHDTVESWSEIHRLAAYGPGADVRSLPAFERLVLATTRLRLEQSQLREMDGRGLLEYAISEGMFLGSALEAATLGEIEVEEDSALAELVLPDSTLPFLRFVRQNGNWHLDLTALQERVSQTLEAQARLRSMSVDELILGILSVDVEQRVTSNIFGSSY